MPSGTESTSTVKLQLFQVTQERRFEQGLAIVSRQRGEMRGVVLCEAQSFDELGDVSQPGGHRVAATECIAAKEQMEYRPFLGATELPVAVRHRELIQIGQQRE